MECSKFQPSNIACFYSLATSFKSIKYLSIQVGSTNQPTQKANFTLFLQYTILILEYSWILLCWYTKNNYLSAIMVKYTSNIFKQRIVDVAKPNKFWKPKLFLNIFNFQKMYIAVLKMPSLPIKLLSCIKLLQLNLSKR